MKHENTAVIAVDESGMPGACRRGSPSEKSFVIAAITYDAGNKNMNHHVRSVVASIRKMCEKRKSESVEEVKWSMLRPEEKLAFARRCMALKQRHGDSIRYTAIMLDKSKVGKEFVGNMEYVYVQMMMEMVNEAAPTNDSIFIYHDERTEGAFSRGWFADYLRMQLLFRNRRAPNINYQSVDSKKSVIVQFADMLAGMFHDKNRSYAKICARQCTVLRMGDPLHVKKTDVRAGQKDVDLQPGTASVSKNGERARKSRSPYALISDDHLRDARNDEGLVRDGCGNSQGTAPQRRGSRKRDHADSPVM